MKSVMFKKKAKAKAAPAADAPAADAPKKKRSKLKLILFILLPLILLGGGYAGWMFFLKPAPEVHAEGEGEEHAGGVDPQKVAALALEAAAETSATYNFALAQLLGPRCGELKVEALRKASDEEAARDGKLINLSWQAALRRAGSVTEVSCERMLNEIDKAEFKLEGGNAAKVKGGHGHGDAHGEADAGHGEKPAEGHGEAPAAHGEAPAAHGDAHAEKPASH